MKWIENDDFYQWIGYLHRTWIWNLFSCVTPGSAGCDVRQKSVLRSSVAFKWRVSVWTTVYNVVLRSVNDSMMRGNCRPSTNSSSSRNHWMRAGGRPSREMHVAWNGWSISKASCVGREFICKSGRRGATEWGVKDDLRTLNIGWQIGVFGGKMNKTSVTYMPQPSRFRRSAAYVRCPKSISLCRDWLISLDSCKCRNHLFLSLRQSI